MVIAVVAANGRSGQVFVRAALKAGHQVQAGIRGKNPFKPSENLRVIECDATNKNQLADLIMGAEAVVSLIGHVKHSPVNIQTQAITHIIQVMELQRCKRLVSLTGTGARLPGDKITIMDRILNLGVSIVDPARVQDGRSHMEELKKSKLDWTVIRILKLQNVRAHEYLLKEHGPTKLFVGREEVASAILEVLNRATFIKEAPIISPHPVK